jgi:thiamine biosynthesis lipoprotein
VTARVELHALGTTAVAVLDDAEAAPQARSILESELARVDATCSRFRADSELTALNRRAGSPVEASDDLRRAIRVALDAAAATGGLVDPTLGAHMRRIGYDRTFERVADGRARYSATRRPRWSWRDVEIDDGQSTVRTRRGVELDLGATAKALAADLIAARLAAAAGCGVLVSLGGDVAVAGESPATGWCVLVADDHAAPLAGDGRRVVITSGGLATSSTTVRRWRTDRGEMHHILDPRTGLPARTPWRTVTVAARTCVDANVASTAALVLGDAAVAWLVERSLPARLVDRDGTVTTVAGWPGEGS